MLFINRNILRASINLAGGSMNDAFNAIFQSGLADIQSAFDIRINIAVWSNIRVRNGYERREMKNNIDIFRDVFTVMRITNIATQNLDVISTINVFKPTPIIEGVILRKSVDFIPLFNQKFRKVRSDKSIRTCN